MMKELSLEELEVKDEELKDINSGMIIYAQGLPEFDPSDPWEVVENNNCRVLGKFPSKDLAIQFGESFGSNSYNTQDTDVATVLRLRANPQDNG